MIRSTLSAPIFSAALFDLDGVLIDTHEGIEALWQRLARARGVRLSADDIDRHIFGCSPEHTVLALFSALDEVGRDQLLRQVRAAEPDLASRALPGATELVAALSAARVRLALVTGASAARTARVLDELRLASCFQARVVWGDAARGKPAPDVYELAAARLGVQPSDCVVFEDAHSGVVAAVAAGAACVGVEANRPELLLAAGASWVVPGLDCVVSAGADAVEMRLPGSTLSFRPPG
ncbi:MAG TPA: HAD family phosphatase [Kofleriaceae bacterium]|nr:HAD family phosphatase [Kofleriaceae bacterium]